MLANYDYAGSGKQEIVFSLTMICNLFLAHILLLNFMIAILSKVYGIMLEQGKFKYKCSLYNFCERYMIAFEEERFGELVVHAPPYNILCVLMVPFAFLPGEVMGYASKLFSYFTYWLENMFFVLGFSILELFMLPVVYIKCLVNIIISTRGIFTTIFYIFQWFFLGILYLVGILLTDVYNLLKILSMHRGCIDTLGKDSKQKLSEDEEKQMIMERIECFNEIRGVVI